MPLWCPVGLSIHGGGASCDLGSLVTTDPLTYLIYTAHFRPLYEFSMRRQVMTRAARLL